MGIDNADVVVAALAVAERLAEKQRARVQRAEDRLSRALQHLEDSVETYRNLLDAVEQGQRELAKWRDK